MPLNLNEISTRLSGLNVLRVSFVDEPAVEDAQFKVVKNFFNTEDIGLDIQEITKPLDAVGTQLKTIISQRDDDAELMKSVVADATANKQLIEKNAQAIDDLAGQIASVITSIESLGDDTKETDEEETQALESEEVITDVVEDSEQGLSDDEIEKLATSLKEHYDSGLLSHDDYSGSLQLLANS
tara:strand:- start:3850 stop:4401 length:552 start_codon:yes stop_codon:yes gene_type:complete